MEGEAREDDPFEGWRLDDDFVGNAAYQEGTAKERAKEQRRRQQEQRIARKQREKYERRQRRADRRAGSSSTWSDPYSSSVPSWGSPRRKPPWRGIFAVVVVGGLLAWNSFVRNPDSSSRVAFGQSADTFTFEGTITDFPSPSDEQADAPLGQPAAPPSEQGTYAFISMQSGSSRPVAYDPCRPIHVVVNERTMPIGGRELVQHAMDDISTATGLQFVMDGPTDEEPSEHRPPVDEERYGDRWAPVLLSWTDPLMQTELEGDIAGFAGSQAVDNGSGDAIYVTGTVALDGPQFVKTLREPNGQASAVAIIRHELGHLVGLDHVQDRNELMYPETTDSNTSLGPGDLTGLNLLGKGACRPDL